MLNHSPGYPQAYDLVYPLATDISKFTPEAMCEVHRRLMDTVRFQGRYAPPGVMRSATRHEVFIDSSHGKRIQCCPPKRVEDEVFKICQLAQVLPMRYRLSIPDSADIWVRRAT